MPRAEGFPSGYYAWLKRPLSGRTRADAVLKARVEQIHQRSRGTYGAPRIRAELAEEGRGVSRKRIGRLMLELGVRGVCGLRRISTTRRSRQGRVASDLVNRVFSASGPNRPVWVSDSERHEALLHRVVVKGHRLQSVAAG